MRSQLAAVLLLFLSAVAAVAQQQSPTSDPAYKPNVFFGDKNKKDKGTTRPVHGTVKDEAGKFVAQAIVELKDVKTGKTIGTIAGQDGSYRFDELKLADDYELQARHDTSTSSVKKLSIYDSRKDPVINFELAPRKDAPSQSRQ